MKRLGTAAVAAAALSACAVNFPQNAEEFRRYVPGARFGTVETFEVNRAFNEVGQTFRRKAAECLNVTVRSESRSQTSYHVVTTVYRPTVRLSKQRAELHVQRDHTTGVVYPGKVPSGGPYLMVVDAYPVGAARTRIEMFRPTVGNKALIDAIRGWATGDNLGCPDLTKP